MKYIKIYESIYNSGNRKWYMKLFHNDDIKYIFEKIRSINTEESNFNITSKYYEVDEESSVVFITLTTDEYKLYFPNWTQMDINFDNQYQEGKPKQYEPYKFIRDWELKGMTNKYNL